MKNTSINLGPIDYVTIKLGTNLLTPHIETPSDYFFRLAEQIRVLRDSDKKVLIVSSGAVGMGKKIIASRNVLNPNKTITIRQKTALASIGQTTLMNTYNQAFSHYELIPAQILISKHDLLNRQHFNTLKDTLTQLLEWGIIPIINENDAVATDELKFGDNDTLAGFIASIFDHSLLLLLTTVDAFYVKNRPVRIIRHFRESYLKYAGASSAGGSGGMKSKLIAGKKMMISGQSMNISDGKNPQIISKLVAGELLGTWFIPQSGKTNARRRWLIHNRESQGEITVDAGAEKALISRRASLLIFGITSVKGNFTKNQIVDIYNAENTYIGKGIVQLSAEEINQFLQETANRESLEKKYHGKEVIHADTLVVLQ